MIRIGLTAGIAIALAGCGHGAAAPIGPPPASVTTSAGTHRLTLGSYCWMHTTDSGSVGRCADSGNPASFPGLAHIRARRGETIVIRLGFTPGRPVTASIGSQQYHLPAHATVRLRVRAGGLLEIGATSGPNDASYYTHVRVAG
jgi:hypothetical protein